MLDERQCYVIFVIWMRGVSFGPWHLTWQDPRPDTLPRLDRKGQLGHESFHVFSPAKPRHFVRRGCEFQTSWDHARKRGSPAPCRKHSTAMEPLRSRAFARRGKVQCSASAESN